MSQEKLEIVRAMYDAFSRHAFSDAVQYLHPEVEVHTAFEGPDSGRLYRGRQECREFLELYRQWDAHCVAFDEIVSDTDDQILIAENWHVRGRHGIELDFKVIDLYTFRDRLIVRVDGFLEKAEALEAVGLSE
jgi:ketosteroid isomerase-like protein